MKIRLRADRKIISGPIPRNTLWMGSIVTIGVKNFLVVKIEETLNSLKINLQDIETGNLYIGTKI